ncbi:glycosyltransferase family 4 protein [Halalkalibacterium halodurans]|uniref:glycosyltransferase family 4 protein n=1 Tax=Halalkalibacterium halodurans TaxID=86665 RepID=UPI002E1EB77B|nr:glycosyltransferase family 4 protein [Halalkalibacterium halodurans]
MKILYIHQYFKTREGFSSTRSLEFAKLFVERGHQVTMLTSDAHLRNSKLKITKKGLITKEYYVEGIHVIAIKNNYSNYMGPIRRIRAFLMFMILSTFKGMYLNKHDIIYATSTPLTIGIPALIINKIRRTPYVFEVRDLWPEAPIQMGVIKNKLIIKFLKKFERLIYQKAEHIVTLSPGMTKGVLKTGEEEKKITMIPNSCDLELFNETNGSLKELNLDSRIFDNNYFSLIHPGSMGKANGLRYILEAAKILKHRMEDDVIFILTGDGKTRPFLEDFCSANDLNNVIFTGNIPKEKMPALLSHIDITITSFKNVPILATNSPNKFFDSLAAGKPSIVNSNGWTKDLVEKNNCGFYVDPENPEDLASLVSNIKNDRINLEKMGRNARALAENNFDRKKLFFQLEQVLLNVKKLSKR